MKHMKNMMKRTMMLLVILITSLVTAPVMAEGGVGFSRNRLVYPASQKSITITVSNHGDSPYLVQAGVSADPAKKVSAPFVVTPPLFRLEGNSQNDIRIVAAGSSLPRDRESVFYFFGTTIPGGDAPDHDKGSSGAMLSIAMRSVMKLFWRPEGLKPSAQEAPGKMQFIRDAKGVLVKNPTPYYQSFAYLEFDGKVQEPDRKMSMIAPFGEQLFISSVPVSKVTWQVMDDYGGATKEVTQSLLDGSGK